MKEGAAQPRQQRTITITQKSTRRASVTYFPHKQKDGSLDSQNPCKKLSLGRQVPDTPALGRWTQEAPWNSLEASLAEVGSSRFSQRPGLKNKVERSREKQPESTSGLSAWHTCLCVYTHTPQINKSRKEGREGRRREEVESDRGRHLTLPLASTLVLTHVQRHRTWGHVHTQIHRECAYISVRTFQALVL